MPAKKRAPDNTAALSALTAAQGEEQHAAPHDSALGLAGAVQRDGLAPPLLAARDVPHLQRAIGNRATSHLLGRQQPQAPQEPAIQRMIDIDGKTYAAEQLAAFNEQYPQESGLQEKILGAITSEVKKNTPKTIQAALSDNRTIYIKKHPRHGYYVEKVEPLDEDEKRIERVQTAASNPVLVTRPLNGSEGLEIGGLIMCIGIVLEAEQGKLTQAACGAHFVTPDCVKNGVINQEGKNQLDQMVGLIQGRGTLSAKLLRAEGAMASVSGAQKDAIEAWDLIGDYLTSLGVANIKKSVGASTMTYYLYDDGSGDFQ
jgi:hypothetical protein